MATIVGRRASQARASSSSLLSRSSPLRQQVSAARSRPAMPPVMPHLQEGYAEEASQQQPSQTTTHYSPFIALLRVAAAPSQVLSGTLQHPATRAARPQMGAVDASGLDSEIDPRDAAGEGPHFAVDRDAREEQNAFFAEAKHPAPYSEGAAAAAPAPGHVGDDYSGHGAVSTREQHRVAGVSSAAVEDEVHADAAVAGGGGSGVSVPTPAEPVANVASPEPAHQAQPEPPTLLQRQLALETEQLSATVREYYDALDNVIRVGRGASMPVTQRLVVRWFAPLCDAIYAEQARCHARTPGLDRSVYGRHLVLLAPEKLAVITIHQVLNSVLLQGGFCKLTGLALEVGRQVESEVAMLKLRSDNKSAWSALNSALKGKEGAALRRNARAALHSDEWTAAAHLKLGVVLISMLCQTARVEVLRDGSLAVASAEAAGGVEEAPSGWRSLGTASPSSGASAATGGEGSVGGDASPPLQADSGVAAAAAATVGDATMATVPSHPHSTDVDVVESAEEASALLLHTSGARGAPSLPAATSGLPARAVERVPGASSDDDLDPTFLATDPFLAATFALDPKPWFESVETGSQQQHGSGGSKARETRPAPQDQSPAEAGQRAATWRAGSPGGAQSSNVTILLSIASATMPVPGSGEVGPSPPSVPLFPYPPTAAHAGGPAGLQPPAERLSASHKAMLRASATPRLERNPATGAVKLTVPAFQHMYMKRSPTAQQVSGVVVLHPRVARLLVEGAGRFAAPTHMPMLMPPVPWESPRKGGYLKHRAPLLRVSPGAHQQADCLRAADMPRVYAALNVLGTTPWRINGFMLAVIKEAVAAGGGIAELPSAARMAAPVPPTEEELRAMATPEERTAAHRRCRALTKLAYNTNTARHSQQCDLLLKLSVAEKFAGEPAIYFPFNMDFRGRVYPVPPHLNHMGNDLCRGLLLFAEGKPLGAAGLRWLKIQLANQMGRDKLPFEERAAFTEAHLEEVFDSADRPLAGRRWWLQADAPWQALSAMRELTLALRSGDPEAYVCRLPIQLDGSCNGLQHYAALGRDEEGGRAVNLLPALPLTPAAPNGGDLVTGTTPSSDSPAAASASAAVPDAAASGALPAATAAAPSTAADASAERPADVYSKVLQLVLRRLEMDASLTDEDISSASGSGKGAAGAPEAPAGSGSPGATPPAPQRQPISRGSAYLVARSDWDASPTAGKAVAAPGHRGATAEKSPKRPTGAALPLAPAAPAVSTLRQAYAVLHTEAEVDALKLEDKANQERRAAAAAASTTAPADPIGSHMGPTVVLDVLAVRRLAARFVLGHVDRKVVKQTVMTSVYGVTFFGARDQVLARLKDRFPLGSPSLPPGLDVEELEETLFVCSSYLARVILASLGDLFKSADDIKRWLGEACKAVASAGQPMAWLTPLGLPVMQPYRRENQFIVRTVLQDVMIADNSEALPVSMVRQRSAFPPNFVHSLDSTHMMLTALDMAAKGLTFTAVHDSYWTHAGDVDTMAASLREQFIALYSQPLLENLRRSLVTRFPFLVIPELPERGSLQLEQVRSSKYFFS